MKGGFIKEYLENSFQQKNNLEQIMILNYSIINQLKNNCRIQQLANNIRKQLKMDKQQQNVQVQNNQQDMDKLEGEGQKKLSQGQKKKLKQKMKKAQQQKKKEQTENQSSSQKVQQTKNEQNGQAKVQQKKDEQQAAGKQAKQGKKDKNKKGGKPMNAAALLAKKKQEQQQKFEQQQQRKRRQYEQQQQRLRKQQQQRKQKQEDQKERVKKEEDERVKIQKKKGLHMTKKQKQKLQRVKDQLQAQKNAPLVQSVKEDQNKEPVQKTQVQIKAEKFKIQKQKKKDQSSVLRDDRIFFQRKQGEFRSPVCAILGHVDTGKTTLLDKIRKTNVQEGQAGGITQQIGATFFPQEKLNEEVIKCQQFLKVQVNVPGLLIIDTPGHESFSNLRSRGSSLCDIAILVIDLMHGLQNQTLESLQLLKKGNTPFVVALNKIDRCYGWQSSNDAPSYLQLKKQKAQTRHDFDTKLQKVVGELNAKGYNADLYWNVQDPDDYIPLVPTSGVTGQGLPDILSLLVRYSTTIPRISKRIRVKKDVFNCTVMQVKMIEGYGTTIDCILVDGKIKKEDQIVLLGFKGPIVTKVKAILTPHPMKQMRVKDQYLHHNQIHAANGIKISATGLDQAVAGTPLFVCSTEDQIQDAMAICQNQFQSIKKKIKLENLGVGVAASTLGSLEALLSYLSSQKVPVSYITVGPVSKDDVMKAMKSVLSQVPQKRKKQYCCMLVFDVKVLHDAQKFAEQNGVKVFTADIIYHLMDYFTKYVQEIRQERKMKQGKDAVFPCVLKQVATFRKNDPIVLGVDVEFGVLKIGTPITMFTKKNKGQFVRIGYVDSIEHNHKKIKQARKQTGSVAVSLIGEPKIAVGKDFTQKDRLVSILTRKSVDCLKEHFRNDVKKEEWELIINLKKQFFDF